MDDPLKKTIEPVLLSDQAAACFEGVSVETGSQKRIGKRGGGAEVF